MWLPRILQQEVENHLVNWNRNESREIECAQNKVDNNKAAANINKREP